MMNLGIKTVKDREKLLLDALKAFGVDINKAIFSAHKGDLEAFSVVGRPEITYTYKGDPVITIWPPEFDTMDQDQTKLTCKVKYTIHEKKESHEH